MISTEYDRTIDICDIEDAAKLIKEAGQMLRDVICRRPGYVELGAAIIYLAKAGDMIDLTEVI